MFRPFLALAIVLLLTMPAEAQQRNPRGRDARGSQAKYSPGDKVEVDWLKWRPAEVVTVQRNGWVKVKFDMNGQTLQPTLPPGKVRRPQGAAAGRPDNPFATPASPTRLQGIRTWTDITGKYKTEAEFVEIKDGQVTLEKADGQRMSMPLEKLSAADQQLIRGGGAAVTPGAAADPGIQPVKGNLAAARSVLLDAPVEWSLAADPGPQPTSPLGQRIISLVPDVGNAFFAKARIDSFDPSTGKALVARWNKPPGGESSVRLERVDLTSGKSQGTLDFEGYPALMAIDPSGRRLVTRSNAFGFGKQADLFVWDVASDAPQQSKIAWQPYPGGNRPSNVGRAIFLDHDRIFTQGDRQLVLWQLPTLEPLYKIKISQQSVPAISPGGKYLAVGTDQGMFILDAVKGEALGKLAGDTGSGMRFAFRSDGLQLAMGTAGGRLQVWDCEKGERFRDIFVQGTSSFEAIDWVSPQHVLVNRSHLVDVERRVLLWIYENMVGGAMLGDKFWAITKGSGNAKFMLPLSIPQEEAVRAVAGLTPEELLALRPGMKVRLNVRVNLNPADRDKVVQALTSQLASNGINVAQNSPLMLEAVAEKGKSHSKSYRSMGIRFGRGSDTVQVTEQVYRLTFKENDKVLWQSRRVYGAPHLLHLKEGQTVQQAIAEQTSPKPGFFLNTPLPRMLARPGKHRGAYGVSKITSQGMQTVSR